MKGFNICALILFVSLHGQFSYGLSEEDLTVTIPNLGTIRGAVEKTSVRKREYPAFRGIPYGNIVKRFSIAEPVEQLTQDDSIFDASSPQVACVQPPSPLEPGNYAEQCLSLNVYTPQVRKTDKQKLLPVIVFIHGGSFYRWSGNLYNAKRLLDRDVVFVSINYRLGVFGFFCLENDEAPGNQGLYDQVLALQWVKSNIEYFGGDPNLVTVAGQSAGGASVTYLLDSPLAKDLVHRAISLSGDDITGWTQTTTLTNSLKAAAYFNCTPPNPSIPNVDLNQVLQCLRAVSAEYLSAALTVFYPAPVVQKFPLTVPKVTPNDPYVSLQTGLQSNVPLIIGATKNDGSFLLSRLYSSLLAPTGLVNNKDFLRFQLVESLLTSTSFGISTFPIGIIDSLIEEYLGKSKNSGNFTEMAPGLVGLYTAFYFKAPAYTTAKYHSQSSPNTYLYSFDFYGNQTFYSYTGGVPQVPRGVTHVDDLMYLFDYGTFTRPEERLISSILVNAWANFAATGDPNTGSAGSPPLFTLWPKFSMDSQKFLKINTIPTVGQDYAEYWIEASKRI